jgi:glycosyltransferase involved in cell wall biosynthesis
MVHKPRLLYLAWTPPTTRGGACLAMHRHLVLHDDFEVFVASSSAFEHERIPSLLLQRHPALTRLSNTRFSRLVRQFEMLVEPYWMLKQVKPLLRQFQPDVILTLPDNTLSWTAYLLAQQTGLPLITNFQDWWPRGQFVYDLEEPYSFTRKLLEQRFRRMYRDSALAFCVSNGMRQYLGSHSNAPLLYACPAPRDPSVQPDFKAPAANKPFRLIYAGTVINAYGRSVLNLAKALRGDPNFEFHVYGPPPDWPESDRAWMEAEGVYRGLLPYDELKQKLREADACLVVMTFETQLRTMMETSFTSKFLDYSQYGKPIVIWGPSYCEPIRLAQSEKIGLPVDSMDVTAVVKALESLRHPEQWITYAEGAWEAATTIFDHNKIHQVFRDSIQSLLVPQPLGYPSALQSVHGT